VQAQLKTHFPEGKKKNSVPWSGGESPMQWCATHMQERGGCQTSPSSGFSCVRC